jgi:hypothetical protein
VTDACDAASRLLARVKPEAARQAVSASRRLYLERNDVTKLLRREKRALRRSVHWQIINGSLSYGFTSEEAKQHFRKDLPRLIELSRPSFINKRWRRTIRAKRDWFWLISHPAQRQHEGWAGQLETWIHQGSSLFVSCVFHEERTPSLHLYADGGFYCHGCQGSGDIVDLAIYLFGLRTVRDVKAFFGLDGSETKIPAHPKPQRAPPPQPKPRAPRLRCGPQPRTGQLELDQYHDPNDIPF